MTNEQIIKHYFQMWTQRDFSNWQQLFTPNIRYAECYGPIYCGYSEMQSWITHQLKVQHVLDWTINSIETTATKTIVMWDFTAKTTRIDYFSGVSLIWFAGQRISRLEEYAMTGSHTRPYQQ